MNAAASVTPMRDRPERLDDRQVESALAAWGIGGVALSYRVVGFGDYHWTAAGAGGRRWFLTVADVEQKRFLGGGPDDARRRLRQAMDTAATLAEDPGLGFVLGPLLTAQGETVRALGERYALSVFPFVEGTPGEYGDTFTDQERGQVIDLLATLHRRPPPDSTPAAPPELALRAGLERALAERGRPWPGGPFAEPARSLVRDHAAALRRRLEEFDQRVQELRRRGLRPVVTHGEPHPGNLLRRGQECLLIDWDTVGLAVPERDLWGVATEPGHLHRYADATGRRPDPSALALYRLRWDLEEVAIYLDGFRTPHERNPDTELAWAGLNESVQQLVTGAPAPS